MSTAAGPPSNGGNAGVKSPGGKDKGKGKSAVMPSNVSVQQEEEEEEEEDDDEDEEMEEDGADEDEEEEEEEEDPEIDPSAIVGRRTRGVRVDYTSKEALEKAGLAEEDSDSDEEMKE